MAENERGWVWYAAQEKDSGKLSVLAVVEVVLSVIAYWWIAAVWQTHLHLLIALIAAPLVLLRSDASVASAQRMWDAYIDQDNKVLLKSIKGIAAVFLATLASFVVAWLLAQYWLVQQEGLVLFWCAALVSWIGWNTGLAVSKVAVESGAIIVASSFIAITTTILSVAVAGVGATAGVVAGSIVGLVMAALAGGRAVSAAVFFPGLLVGTLLRSLATRAFSILLHLPTGMRFVPGNWRRIMLIEDISLAPEIMPGVMQSAANFRFNSIIKRFIVGDIAEKAFALLVLIFLFIPSLIWRYSLKSTFWFYAPLIYIASPGKFADTEHRRLMIDRNPPLLDWGRFVFAGVALFVAGCALVDWPFWRGLMRDTEVFSPVGWLLVLDWGKLWDQPWQIPSIAGAVLTVVIFLWIDSLRKTRRRLEATGDDPETAMDAAFSTERHPGLTLYWLNRVRTVLVVASLLIGFWYFAKGSYEAGYLTRIEPVLSSVFGAR